MLPIVYRGNKLLKSITSKELLLEIKAFCKNKGIGWLPAEPIEAKYPDLFEN